MLRAELCAGCDFQNYDDSPVSAVFVFGPSLGIVRVLNENLKLLTELEVLVGFSKKYDADFFNCKLDTFIGVQATL